MAITGRHDDMHPVGDGVLRVYPDRDGDMIVAIDAIDPVTRRPTTLSVEFCTIGAGGGASPQVYQALKTLAEAIEQDNKTRPSHAYCRL